MIKEDIVLEIKKAFYAVTLGNGIGLWEAQAIDDYESKEIQKRERKKDEKYNWQFLDDSDLDSCHSSLSFFDANGMRFHLPAYIIRSLEGNVEDPIFHLTHLNDYGKAKFSSLSPEQSEAILNYLKWCLKQEEFEFESSDIRKAIDEYWSKK